MRRVLAIALGFALIGISPTGSAQVGSLNEADLIEAADDVVRSSMPPEEKIERLEMIEAKLASVRKKRQADPGGPAPKKTVAREAEPKPTKSEIRPATPAPTKTQAVTVTETDDSPGFFSRMLFWLLRFFGFVAAAGLLAATVFVLASNGQRVFGFFKNVRNSGAPASDPFRTPPPIGSTIGGRPASSAPRTRTPAPRPPPVANRNRIPRDGAVPTHLC